MHFAYKNIFNMDKSIIINKIKEYYKFKTDAEFARFLDVKPQTLSSWYRRNTFDIDLLYAKCIDIDGNWLLTGKGPMLKETIDNACMPNNAIPLITEDVILKIKDSNFKIPNEDIKQQYVIPDFENVDFLTPIKGSSMYPKYSPGDLVACRILHNPKYIQWNKIYIIITKDQGVLYKRLLPSVLKDHYKLVSDNDEYPPFDIPIDEITNIALVIGAIRLE